MRRKRGFTLIELLVVIAIIGLLSAVTLAGLSTARKKGRDARRISDLRQLQTAIELYRDQFGVYPNSGAANAAAADGESAASAPSGCYGIDTSKVDGNADGRPFISDLASSGIMKTVPLDPAQGPVVTSYVPPWDCDVSYTYGYAMYPAGSNGCPVLSGRYYVLGVTNMEAASGVHPLSPGFKCSGRDWQLDYYYVTGGFEG